MTVSQKEVGIVGLGTLEGPELSLKDADSAAPVRATGSGGSC